MRPFNLSIHLDLILAAQIFFVKQGKPSMMKSANPKILPFLLFPIGILAISSSSIFTRLGQAGAPSLVIAVYRLLIAGGVLLLFVISKNRGEFRKVDRKTLRLFLFAALFLAAHFASWITSLEFTSIASSVVLVTTTPVWVAVFSPFVLKEKISMKMWLGIMLAVLGSVIVAASQACHLNAAGQVICPQFDELFAARSFWGNLLALVGAWMAAGYMIVGRKMRNRFSITFYAFMVYSLAGLFLLIVVILSRLPLFGYSNESYLWMILLALIPQLIGHSTFNWALGFLPASLVSVAFMAEPVGTIILALIIFRETPLIPELAGGALILVGILVVSLANRRFIRKLEKV